MEMLLYHKLKNKQEGAPQAMHSQVQWASSLLMWSQTKHLPMSGCDPQRPQCNNWSRVSRAVQQREEDRNGCRSSRETSHKMANSSAKLWHLLQQGRKTRFSKSMRFSTVWLSVKDISSKSQRHCWQQRSMEELCYLHQEDVWHQLKVQQVQKDAFAGGGTRLDACILTIYVCTSTVNTY